VQARDLAALDVEVGVPTHVEKTGHWINVDGIWRDVRAALAPPKEVRPLEDTLAELARRLASEGARAR
jgi:hypothetical protein